MNFMSQLQTKFTNRLHQFKQYASILGVPQTILLLYAARLLRISNLNLRIHGIAHTIRCRPTGSDRYALSQIFIEHDSDIPMTHSPKLIIDGGANVGYVSVLFANKYPDALILAIEPDLTNYQIARHNCSKYPNIQVIRAGIWTSDTSLVIENPDAESWAFKVCESASPTPNSVPGYTISSLLTYYGIDMVDLLKLDIEGAEENIFSSPNLEWLSKVKILAVEIHNKTAHEAIVSAMMKFSFTQSMRGEKHIFVNQ